MTLSRRLHPPLLSLLLGLAFGGGDPIVVSIARGEKGAFFLQSDFRVDADLKTTWDVLTDFERIPTFVSSISRSKVRMVDRNHLLLDQEARWRVLFVGGHSHVLLDTRLKPMREISFTDLKKSDFSCYEGGWLLEDESQRVHVRYLLKVRLNFALLHAVATGMLRETAARFLNEVRDEIDRRTRPAGGRIESVAGEDATTARAR